MSEKKMFRELIEEAMSKDFNINLEVINSTQNGTTLLFGKVKNVLEDYILFEVNYP